MESVAPPGVDASSLDIIDYARLLIYSLSFEQAETVLAQTQVKEGKKRITLRRLHQALEFNRASPLINDLALSRQIPTNYAGEWLAHWTPSGGLMIKGETHSDCSRVCLFVNSRLIKVINTDIKPLASEGLNAPDDLTAESDAETKPGKCKYFNFHLKANLLKTFPRRAGLAIGSEMGALLHKEGVIRYQDPRLLGYNTLFKKLDLGYFVTKKGQLHRLNTTNPEWKTEILETYIDFREYFEKTFNYKLFIIYGTLLGYHREGDFIPKDDDFDAAYLSKYTLPEDIKQEIQIMMEQMLHDGRNLFLSQTRAYFKPVIDELKFTVFPMWFDDNKLWMQNTTCLDIGKDAIEPIQRKDFLGVQVYVPNKPEEFIAAKYGPNWKTPDPGYRPVAKRGTEEYLERSALNEEEYEAFCKKISQAKKENPHMGKLYASRPGDQLIIDLLKIQSEEN